MSFNCRAVSGSASGSRLAAALIARSSATVGIFTAGRLDAFVITHYLPTIGAAQADDPAYLATVLKREEVEDPGPWCEGNHTCLAVLEPRIDPNQRRFPIEFDSQKQGHPVLGQIHPVLAGIELDLHFNVATLNKGVKQAHPLATTINPHRLTTYTPPMPHPTLSPTETRVLAVLAEKERTVPDTYPLTLNTLLSGCNQKTSRDPVMSLTESEVQQALDTLKYDNLAIESSGSRVPRYSHNMERVLNVPTQSSAILAVLMLRGPQTTGELRIRCDRMHKFADVSAVEGFLNELAGHPDGALVQELARQPGARENRWAHLLSGPIDVEAPQPKQATSTPAAPQPTNDVTQLREDLSKLQAEVDALKQVVEDLREKPDQPA